MAQPTGPAEEFYRKYGYLKNACDPGPNYNEAACSDWKALTHSERGYLKDERPFYRPPGGEEQRQTREWWEKYQAGPDINIWKGLSEILGMKPGAIKKFAMGKLGKLMERPDFAKEYGLRAEDLQQGLSEQFAARGLLDSSMMGAAMGKGMSGLMQERALMEENAWMNRLGKAGGFLQQGTNFAQFLNKQYLQDLKLGAEAIAYLTGERERGMEFDINRYAINPNINDPITTWEGATMVGTTLAEMAGAFMGTGAGGFEQQAGFEEELPLEDTGDFTGPPPPP